MATSQIPSKEADVDKQFRYAWLRENEKPRATIEHYNVRWSIQNFSLIPPEDEYKCIISPVFCFDASDTLWRIILHPNIFKNGQKLASFGLQRLHEDSGPESVGITYRFGILNSCNNIWFEERKRTAFRKGNINGAHLETYEYVNSLPETSLVHDTLKVICEVYISYVVIRSVDRSFSVADYDLINLSFNLTKLMRSKELSDFCVKIPHWEIVVHKAVLAARSPVFRNILEDDNCDDCVELLDMSFSNLTNLLSFMYSGNFNLIARNGPPDIGLYECAVEFSVSDLVDLLTPKYLQIRSLLETEELEYTWHLDGISKRLTNATNCISSPPFRTAYDGEPDWTLTLYAERISDSLYNLDVFAESSMESKSLHSILKISLLDDEGMFLETKTTTKSCGLVAKFGFPKFLETFSIQNNEFVQGDTLRVHCLLTFVISRDILFENHVLACQSVSTEVSLYLNLSDDLKKLFMSSTLCDVTLNADGLTINAHRAVLSARSRVFASKLLYSVPKNGTLEISGIDPDVVSLMVDHAYSGILKEPSQEMLLKLLSASTEYGCISLSLVCVKHLTSNINKGNVFELMNIGKKVRNFGIVEKCLSFVEINAAEILASAGSDETKKQEIRNYELLSQLISKVL